MRPLTCDANGRLECSVDALEVSMAQVNLNTDTLEAKIQATTDKLDSFAGAGNNTVGEGQSKLQVFNYGKDGSTYRPMTVDSSGHLQVDVLSTALPSGSATEATLAAAEVHLGAIQTAVTAGLVSQGMNPQFAGLGGAAIGAAAAATPSNAACVPMLCRAQMVVPGCTVPGVAVRSSSATAAVGAPCRSLRRPGSAATRRGRPCTSAKP